jgi:hypothetical protein
VQLTLSEGWVNNGGSKARARLLARGSLIQVFADVSYPPSSSIPEGWIIAPLPAGLRPVEETFVPGTTNTYRSGTIYVIGAKGICVGPYSVGSVCQLNGLAAMK